ncbi:UNVERIFIED_ORG: hypothetical protein DFO49_4058 [Herbaspirillum seropedicae]
MTIKIGEVISVAGVKVTLKIDEDSSRETMFFNGEKYKGVSIREFLSIQRGFRNIVCIVEGEYLDESRVDTVDGKVTYIRKVDARPIGYFENSRFFEGIKFLPMIKDPAALLPEGDIAAIFSRGTQSDFVIGRMLKEDIPISLPWHKLFNSHIGIFGNTGSGKSNTLTKIFTVLFEKKSAVMTGKSKFIFLDFNGEYTGNQFVEAEQKTVINLVSLNDPVDQFPLSDSEFWDADTFSILFQATPNTQKPFLSRLVTGRSRFSVRPNSLQNYVKSIFRKIFSAASPKPETLELALRIATLIEAQPLMALLSTVSHNRQTGSFFIAPRTYFGADGAMYDEHILPLVNAIDLGQLDAFDELVLRAHLQLCRDLISGYVQFEHIQPVLKRIDASLTNLRKVLTVENAPAQERLLTVISMRRCHSDVKKILPLLIAKHFYNAHKRDAENPPMRTIHLVIDEAHNILSQQSAREHESWRDYRLDLFEEIIKEGRKFGVFLTVSSQRPADISPTVISQLHNFFIHRLVNDRDLFLINNTISTLDNVSKGMIPTLGRGACVVTGTAFDIPMVLQVDMLERERQPDSEDVDLQRIWANE